MGNFLLIAIIMKLPLLIIAYMLLGDGWITSCSIKSTANRDIVVPSHGAGGVHV